MKSTPDIPKLISSYFNKSISEDQFKQLSDWINASSENKEIFTEYLRVYKTSSKLRFLETVDEDLAWKQIVSKTKRHLGTETPKSTTKTKYLSIGFPFVKYAALAVLFLGIGYLVTRSSFFSSNEETVVPPGSIVLEMENGDIKILNAEANNQLTDGQGNVIGLQHGKQLTYDDEQKHRALVYNTLTIPYGKRFSVKLSDGTTVFLNSGTSLKYPVKFIKGQKRNVYLTGEAHFDVTKDAEHPFVVTSNNIQVQVLGTTFNVSAYPEDNLSDVVLIEGSVKMSANKESVNQSTTLVPGMRGSINKGTKRISTQKVDTTIYTSWMQGELFFRNMPFENIVKKLERHYDRKIVILNKALKEEKFNASFKEEPLENVLSYFKESYNIEYKTKDNIIYIN
ncbi:DUF4974 domain-containing protein [Flavobacteriaceae bacterium GSB9]|nr:DUF4974 domain-containing protein [Flavobacteriaceae bacterium GSB9]